MGVAGVTEPSAVVDLDGYIREAPIVSPGGIT